MYIFCVVGELNILTLVQLLQLVIFPHRFVLVILSTSFEGLYVCYTLIQFAVSLQNVRHSSCSIVKKIFLLPHFGIYLKSSLITLYFRKIIIICLMLINTLMQIYSLISVLLISTGLFVKLRYFYWN